MLINKDFTEQENILAQCLSELGIRYEQQVFIEPYTVDFFLPELNCVIEADGIFGHLKKRDAKRDLDLLNFVNKVVHVKEKTKEGIKLKLEQLFCQE